MTQEIDWDFNPVDFFNRFGSWKDCFAGMKLCHWISDTEVSVTEDPTTATYRIEGDQLIAITARYGITPGKKYSKFMVFTILQYKGDYHSALSYVAFSLMGEEIPYIRVGTDYFKIFHKRDRYGVDRKIIKGWRKEEIKQDHDPTYLKKIARFNDFCIEPDNITYRQCINNCYNVYSEFSHLPHPRPVTERDLPTSLSLMRHIFGDQYEMGLTYMKVLYELPRQVLPVLCLVSSQRQTGKTTFINWVNMIFGDNFVLINPEDLSSSFNASYATKNIITIDETVIDKISSVEKLKSIATAKSISVNQKHVSHYMLPFFAKVIICTNKEKDFMRIDEEEIRFWVRKVKSIEKINTNIESDLADEIPRFLRYLQQRPEVDVTRSRMVFTPEEISNEDLQTVKTESYSWLRKELIILITEYFNTYPDLVEFHASGKDLKDLWFNHNHQVTASYIIKVLKDELKLTPATMMRYTPPGGDPLNTKPGKPYIFQRKNYETEPVRRKQTAETLPF